MDPGKGIILPGVQLTFSPSLTLRGLKYVLDASFTRKSWSLMLFSGLCGNQKNLRNLFAQPDTERNRPNGGLPRLSTCRHSDYRFPGEGSGGSRYAISSQC